ncbi:MAG: sugar phosphate isomerase/epimerase [Oscillospiraceae bacterium]|jgi:sugar phosphate isomerase/epimerase|nr:sugar phosphate isomerase/epimerase [Oscillospiraceae bacterium]
MAKIKIGSPLFIVRDLYEKDLFGVLEKIASIGFDGVEFVGLRGYKAADIRQKMDSLKMETIGNHVNVREFSADPKKVIDDHKTLGCKYITLAWPDKAIITGSPEFEDVVSQVRALCDTCYENGFTPIYHNHNFEFGSDPSWVHILMEACKDQKLCLEPDLGWMTYAGSDPLSYLTQYRDAMPIIHMKDIYVKDFSKVGPGVEHRGLKNNPDTGYFEFRPTGYGVVNFPRLLPYILDCNPDWIIPDHDLAYERDPFDDLRLSYDYTVKLLDIQA